MIKQDIDTRAIIRSFYIDVLKRKISIKDLCSNWRNIMIRWWIEDNGVKIL